MPDEPTEILPPAGEAPPARSSAPRVVLPPAELIGRTLGKFTVVERLGRGGSGEVFRAEQPQLGRSAVIKVLLREVSLGAHRVERFLREAKLASRLDHPYAAHIYAFGAEADGVLWIAMEHVKGATLDELVARRGPMPAAIFAPLFARLCEVVHTAHELGIVHRDIKGSNVMVIERAGQLLPKLLDFGIAKGVTEGVITAPQAVGEDAEITQHGATLGSPHYMSPEQWESAADVDARADIYALGVLAYRGLAGRLPFQDYARPSLPGAHTTIAPPPLPDRVPVRLAEVVMRALAKRPDERWQTAVAFGDAVQRAVGGAAPETVPLFDPATREIWVAGGPQPIADAVAHLAGAVTTVEADTAVRDLVAIACRWLAVVALGALERETGSGVDAVRERARGVVGRDDGVPWLALARAATIGAGERALPGLVAALGGADALAVLAERLDDRDRARTVTALATDVAAAADALRGLEPLLAYALVVGRGDGSAESWQGTRRRDRERVVVWSESGDVPLAAGAAALLDGTGRVVAILSPLVQVASPLPHAEPELFFLWRGGRGSARLVAAPWGFERDDDAAGQRLAQLTTEDELTQHDAPEDKSPYPGLLAYRADDADRFVGREREVESLANRLVRAPLIAVLGPSGAGKSSFIAAGVLPRLAEHYSVVTIRPGRHPMHALAAAFPGTDTEDPAALVAKLRALGETAPRGLVIVVDQLEELVTLCAVPRERTRFAEALAAAADGAAAPVRVVVTLRDDFATVIESEAALRGKFDVFVLAAPAPEALRRIVTEPARRAGVTVDPKVVDDMVAEVAGRPASLPLLSFTAAQLWQSRDRIARKIAYEAYAALGGVAGALSTYADQTYDSLARSDQEVARRLFARLVATDGTRIPVPRAELEELANAPRVLAHLIDARLLVVRESDGADIVELVHECLAERWERLARWRREDAADRALLADVRVAARRWHDANRAPDRLWRGAALGELRRLAIAAPAGLTDLERAFADAADRAERRARTRRRAIVATVMVALAAVAIAMSALGLAERSSRAAAVASERDAREAAARAADAAHLADDRLTQSLVAQGRRELNDGRGLAASAYFAEVLRRGLDTPALRYMIAVAERARPYERLVYRDAKLTAIAMTDDAILAGDQDGVLHVWTHAGVAVAAIPTKLDEIRAIDATHVSKIAVAAAEGVAVIDLAAKQVAWKIAVRRASAVHLGPGADEVTVIGHDAITVYAETTGTARRHADFDQSKSDAEPQWGAGTRSVFFAFGTKLVRMDLVAAAMPTTTLEETTTDGPVGSADGSRIAWLDRAHVLHVVDADGKAKPLALHPTNGPLTMALSATGDRIAAVAERSVAVFDGAGKPLRDVQTEANEAFVQVRGDDLWAGTPIGLVRHYRGESLVASLPSHVTEIEDLRVRGNTVAAAGSDGSLVALDAGAELVKLDPDVCVHGAYTVGGTAVGYLCDTGNATTVYVGHHRVGELASEDLQYGAFDAQLARGAAGSPKELAVFDAAGKPLGRAHVHTGGPFALESATTVLAVDPGEPDKATAGLYRWDFAADTWARLATDTAEVNAIAVVEGGILTGGNTHELALRAHDTGAVSHRVAVDDRIDAIEVSADRAWAAVTLAAGGTLIVDGKTGNVARTLAPADAVGFAATLDPHGDLLVRAARGGLMTVWDARSGDELVWSAELMRAALTARFAADGRLEIAGRFPGEIAIPRETRPVAEILRAIECRDPLRVVDGSRLEAREARLVPAGCKSIP